MDETDLQILSLLQADARIGNAEISRRVGLAASAVHERIRKLEQRGVVGSSEMDSSWAITPGSIRRRSAAVCSPSSPSRSTIG